MNIVNIKLITLTSILFISIGLSIFGCSKKLRITKIKPVVINCGTNQMPSGDTCICDTNSVKINGVCTYIMPGFSKYYPDSEHCYTTVSKNCGDWRDSIHFPYSYDYFKPGQKQFLIGVRQAGWAIIAHIDYYKEFANYDSVSTDEQVKVPNRGWVKAGFRMRVSKNRDSIWAKVCHTQWNPKLIALDSCEVILTKQF